MAMITKSEFGTVAINNDVLSRLVLEHMLDMDDCLLPCNKRGKPYRRSIFQIGDEATNYVDIRERKQSEVTVKVYIITRFGKSINKTSNELFDRIEKEFELLNISKPKVLTAYIRGVMSKQLVERNLEVTRHND